MLIMVISCWVAVPVLASLMTVLQLNKPTDAGGGRTDDAKRYWLVVFLSRLSLGIVGVGWMASTQMFGNWGWIGAIASLCIALALVAWASLNNRKHQASKVAGVATS